MKLPKRPKLVKTDWPWYGWFCWHLYAQADIRRYEEAKRAYFDELREIFGKTKDKDVRAYIVAEISRQ